MTREKVSSKFDALLLRFFVWRKKFVLPASWLIIGPKLRYFLAFTQSAHRLWTLLSSQFHLLARRNVQTSYCSKLLALRLALTTRAAGEVKHAHRSSGCFESGAHHEKSFYFVQQNFIRNSSPDEHATENRWLRWDLTHFWQSILFSTAPSMPKHIIVMMPSFFCCLWDCNALNAGQHSGHSSTSSRFQRHMPIS